MDATASRFIFFIENKKIGSNICLKSKGFCLCCRHGIKRLRFGWADGPGYIIIYAATSFWLPVLLHRVFNFLRDEKTRSQVCIKYLRDATLSFVHDIFVFSTELRFLVMAKWDTVSTGNLVQEVAHIENGSHPGNCVSLLRLNVSL